MLYRVDPAADWHFCSSGGGGANHPAITDGMHTSLSGGSSGSGVGANKRKGGGGAGLPNKNESVEVKSQRIKEIKQHLLVQLIDKFDISCEKQNAKRSSCF